MGNEFNQNTRPTANFTNHQQNFLSNIINNNQNQIIENINMDLNANNNSQNSINDNENNKAIINDSLCKKVKLKTGDNRIFEVPINILDKVALISNFIKLSEEGETILLKEVDGKDLEIILDYLNHYKDMEPKEVPKPFPERTDDEFLRSIVNDNWTFDFLQRLTIEEAINLVNTSNYLQIEGLINLLAAKCAHEMCNCEIEEARQKFGIECDMTEEEVAEYDKYPLD